MVRNIVQVHTKIVVYWQVENSWQISIVQQLEEQGYQVLHADLAYNDRGMSGEYLKTDVVLTDDPDFGNALRKSFGNLDYLPIFVFITEHHHNHHMMNWADLILPPDITLLDHNVQCLRNIRQEKQDLALQYEHLKQQLDQHKRMADQVEILKDAIVRNVSHELKTPLLQVKSAVALLAEDVKDEKLIHYAKNATGRLETLVKNITLLGSSLDTSLSPVIVRDSVEYARRNLQRIWEHHDASTRITLELGDRLPPVLADKQGLSTALQLLMDNALKFSEGKIFVQIHQIGTYVQFRVRDHGIGIAPQDAEAIFDTFYQVDSSSTRRYGGTGIGLAIVRLILENHNTDIQLESEIGKGSTFLFELPVVDVK